MRRTVKPKAKRATLTRATRVESMSDWFPCIGTAFIVGEILCDLFVPERGIDAVHATHFVPHLGGAPANVAVQMARLGSQTALCTAIGADPFGKRLFAEIIREGIDGAHVHTIVDRKTGITLVEVDSLGERFFTPWRERSADLGWHAGMLRDVDWTSGWLLHHGTVSLRADPAYTATLLARDQAKEHGLLISLDVNLRFGMYSDKNELIDKARDAIKHADLVKATVEEAEVLFTHELSSHDVSQNHDAVTKNNQRVDGDISPKIHQLLDVFLQTGITLLFLTDGAHGAYVATQAERVYVPAPQAEAIDATGAGDAFCGAALAWLARFLAAAIPPDASPDASPDTSSNASPNASHAPSYRHRVASMDRAALHRLGMHACIAGTAAVGALGATTAMIRHWPTDALPATDVAVHGEL